MSVKLHASEADMPEGLNKVLTWITQGIEETSSPVTETAGGTTPTGGTTGTGRSGRTSGGAG